MKELESFLSLQTSLATKRNYKNGITEFLNYFNIKDINDFKKIELLDYSNYKNFLLSSSKNNSLNSIKTKFLYLSSFSEYLINEEHYDINNYAKILAKKTKPDIIKRSFIGYSDASNLINNCQNSREYAMIMLFLDNGLRVSELINAKINDYDANKAILSIKRKGGEIHTIPLTEASNNAIQKYLKDRKETNCSNLFISNGGNPMQVNSIDRTIKKISKKANITTNISAHSLRRSLATDLHKKGYDIESIKNVLGHKNISTTSLYIRDELENARQITMQHSFLK